ncbi:hypothetical protein GCM10011514_47650 [Emticicia aquatilis]|uniref:Uncharacterized protein n=1 Tax=Emticicia aquatilis TaxID=1537369 RepID=A0A916Z5S8_9BACT|nr:hypothetical protein [Emticicia aquatilis]GGD78130.1 hypothetical protein GCM10011514_47650 [Emticicia aquatilis]
MPIRIIQILKSVNSILLIISCLLVIENSYAQKPIGRFQTDSIELGRPIDYTLSYHHSPSAEVFFPDTTYNFYPFEIIRRNIFPTSTTNGVSTDSVVYTLVTFDIRKTQKLELPIYLLSKRDCTAVYSLADSVFLKEMIKTSVDSLQLKTDTKLLPLSQQVNYPKILTYILGLLGIALIIYAFFGRFIRKQYTLFLFGRRHKDFQTNYKKFTRSTLDDVTIGKALVLWKKHLEWLEKRPYTSYTTKEIISRLPSERLEEALREVDSAIYGGILSTQMPLAMNVLLDKATELYKNRREELAASL